MYFTYRSGKKIPALVSLARNLKNMWGKCLGIAGAFQGDAKGISCGSPGHDMDKSENTCDETYTETYKD